jgi:hypothetical protein
MADENLVANAKKKRKGKMIEGVHGKRRLDRPGRKSGGRVERAVSGGVFPDAADKVWDGAEPFTRPSDMRPTKPVKLDKVSDMQAPKKVGSADDVGIKAIPNKQFDGPVTTVVGSRSKSKAAQRLAEIDAEGKDAYDKSHGIGQYAKKDDDEDKPVTKLADDSDAEKQPSKKGGVIKDTNMSDGHKDQYNSDVMGMSAGKSKTEAVRKRGGRC